MPRRLDWDATPNQVAIALNLREKEVKDLKKVLVFKA